MNARCEPLQSFLDGAVRAYRGRARDPNAKRSLDAIFADLGTVGRQTAPPAGRLSACFHLEDADLRPNSEDDDLQGLMESFRRLEPSLAWYRRRGISMGAGENFHEGHANAMIIGAGGLEDRSDASLGVSLLAPNVVYPDHTHPPEETYLVIAPGAFRQGASSWIRVGVGGTFYNPPGIVHSMRSENTPLLAFWALREVPAD